MVNLEADTPSAGAIFPVAVTRNAGDARLPAANVVANLTPGHAVFPGCASGDGWQYVRNLGKAKGTVGSTYVPTSHATQQFTYDVGQSSSIGFGYSTEAGGGFKFGGTASWSSSLRTAWPTFGANRSVWYQTEFNFGEYKCNILGVDIYYLDIVNGYAGGATIKTPTFIPSTPSKWCVDVMSGVQISSNNSAAVTWTGNVDIGTPVVHFGASIQTGYDHSAQLTYKFSAFRQLCGQKGDPGGAPGQLVVRT